ncbi:hypothetical protein PS838_05201 [Pseudomonas fluorescens]|nr:hypothetical protein PS838_05201 [Pseudomonas fluorescens]
MQLRTEAGWAKRGIRGVVITGLGLAGDLLKPWFHFLPWMSLIAIVVAFGGFALWWRASCLPVEQTKNKRRIAASLAMYGLLSSFILTPILTVDLATDESSGVAAKAIRDLHVAITNRFDQVDNSLSGLTNQVTKQRIEIEKQTETMATVKEKMDHSVALTLLDRARTTRDGSNQGQALAIQTLLARGYDFVDADLSGISLASAHLDRANFSGGVMHFLNIDGARLHAANFKGADLRFATARNTDFSTADLSNAFAVFLSGRGASFIGAKLQGINFYGADLSQADFTDADLTGAVLAFANLEEANFTRTKLAGSYLTGALLVTANMTDAEMEGTDVLGAVRDPATLSPTQRSQLCRHNVNDIRFDIRLKERRESNRYPSGYEYEDVSSYGEWVTAPSLNDKTLPVCPTHSDEVKGYNSKYPAYMSLFLERNYLKNANRFSLTQELLKDFYTRLNAAYANGNFLVGDNDYRESWIKKMRQATVAPVPDGTPLIDSDLMLVWLLSQHVVSPEEVDWSAMVQTRLRIEKARASRPELPTRWGNFFPVDAQFNALPDEAISLFRDWTVHRGSELGNRLVIQTSSKLLAEAGDANRQLYVSDSGYIRSNLEGLSISIVNSWSSDDSALVKQFVPDVGRARPAPARLVLAKNNCCMTVFLVFPDEFTRYALSLPNDLHVDDDSTLELELSAIDVQRPKPSRTALVFVKTGEARIRDNKGRVVFTGELHVVPE